MTTRYRSPGRRMGYSGNNENGYSSPSPFLPTGKPPLSAIGAPVPSSDVGSAVSAGRQRQSRRDEAIRRKVEADLSKKRAIPAAARPGASKRSTPGTVAALKPSMPLTVHPDITVSDASQFMAAKREDCVLVIDEEQHLAGIFTAKDLAFRVVGTGINPREVFIRDIMTPNPMCARQSSAATDALELMVQRGFRHLPVLDDDGDVLGILDITKCFNEAMEKLERAYSSSKKLHDALEGVQTEFGGSGQPPQMLAYIESLREKMAGPSLAAVINGSSPVTVSVRTSVREATSLMRENHTTAVLVMDGASIAGIFTSKDVVLRVIAAGLEPSNCSVVRVMTPHPDTVHVSTTIQTALRKMHDGHYLNLPVTDDQGVIGMVDVLKLTYATLEQINQFSLTEGEGPIWNRFWNNLGDDEADSVISESQLMSTNSRYMQSAMPGTPGEHKMAHVDSSPLLPNDSASLVQQALSSPVQEESFAFKFKSPNGRAHRIHFAPSLGLAAFRTAVLAKLSAAEIKEVGGDANAHLSFVDDEGDVVSLTVDQDLRVAVDTARSAGRLKVDIFVHHEDQPPQASLPALTESFTAQQPPNVQVAERSFSAIQTSPQSEKKRETVVPIGGLSHDFILPGAIVIISLAIITLFTFRSSLKN